MKSISIVIPTLNEAQNIEPLIERLLKTFENNDIQYEVIFIDDNSSDDTRARIESWTAEYPISLHLKTGNKGKARSLIEGFLRAQYDTIAMIDADLQYAPEEIPVMLDKIEESTDIVIANRNKQSILARFLHSLDYDVLSGLKVFKKEIIERITLDPRPWTFDLEFLLKARNAGYTIASHDIEFSQRWAAKPKKRFFPAFTQMLWEAISLKFARAEVVPFSSAQVEREGHGFHYKAGKYIHHSNLDHHETAFKRLSLDQRLIFALLAVIVFFGFLFDWHLSLVIILSLLTTLYFADLLFNFYLIYRSFSKAPEIKIEDEEIKQRTDWPSYTVFCPLYREWQVLPQFVTAMSRLDYPKDKLQVLLLLEEDDEETIQHAQSYNLPDYFQIVIVPHSLPKTKPKALNYGLKYAKGEHTVIYDAEDIPDPLQLKKAILAFQKAGPRIICVQAKLNFYNPHQNLLTKIFTAEYSLWFDLVLTGLQSIHAPIPLGGTSNHFRTDDLHKLKGWDSFNVTEDADLGIRLVKRGYRTAIIDSVTLEEANSGLRNWFNQRIRWIKGYIQTYFSHMRSPGQFNQTWSEPHLMTFQLVIGGKVISMMVNPIMWAITIAYFAFRMHIGTFIESFFPTPILYIGTTSLILGNFLYMYYYMIGCAKWGHDELVKYVFLVPLYWLAMSISTYIAFYKFIADPHHWYKTKHGLHLGSEKAAAESKKNIEKELIDGDLIGNFTANSL